MVTCKILSINLRIFGGRLVGEDWRPKQDVSSQLFSLSIWYILTNKITRWREIDFHSSLQHVFKYRNQLLREIDILNWYTILKLIYSSFKYINNNVYWKETNILCTTKIPHVYLMTSKRWPNMVKAEMMEMISIRARTSVWKYEIDMFLFTTKLILVLLPFK